MNDSGQLVVATEAPFGVGGYLPITYIVLGIRAFIGAVGICLNWSLVLITVKKKSLRSSCGILLAFDALGHSFYETGLLSTFLAALIRQRFIELFSCLCIQSLSLFGAIFTTPSMLFIALDRLIAVIFPM
ncbi:hypothetical protein AAVH_30538, partial [Aphelenchoides avenae]